MTASARRYWRSLEGLADDPRARAFLEREFPEHASELPEGVTRRTMLTLIGASLSLAGLAACRRPVEKIVPYVNAPEEVVPGIPQHYATTMPVGNDAYGLVVECHEGRPTKIEGNSLHPSSLGATSAIVQASILDLYDPDRSPAVRHGAERKTWTEFCGAWAEIAGQFADNGGEGLALLTEPFSSPTLARLARLFRSRFPKAHWATWEPTGDANVFEGAYAATGIVARPVYQFDRASVVLSLDSDFLQTESNAIRHARDFADGRRISSPSDTMNRLYVVETALSLTGGNADHRLRLQGGQVAVFLARLLERLRSDLALDLPGPAAHALEDPRAEQWTELLARELVAARGRSLIVAGSRQPESVHAATFALNAALDNVGRTLTFRAPADAALGRQPELSLLVSAMNAGKIRCLVVLGANPVYAGPADLDFAGAMAAVPTVVHLGSRRDETGRLAAWHLPQAHYLESWGDARAADGTASVVQPLIAPLFGGVSGVEVLGLLAGGEPRPGYELVRETWLELLGPEDFEARFSRVLHDGLLSGSAGPEIAPRPRAGIFFPLQRDAAAFVAAHPADLELCFYPSPAMLDGRHANNGWLQELPDPVTKLTWDNAALLSPATARSLGLENGDLALLSYGQRELETPVWIVPGQADRSVALHLGWGRSSAGRVGDGRGFNAFLVRTTAAPYIGRGVTLAPTGRRHPLAQTQDHGSMEGRPAVREASLAEFRESPSFANAMVEFPPLHSLWPDRAYDTGHQWGMTIDLTACNGCNACVIACQSENNIPIVGKEQVSNGREMHWIRVDRYFNGEVADPETVFQPVPCMQCENAPCEQVCPVAATVHDAEGLNTMVYNRCIGTRYCANNCPYKVRRFNFFNFTKDTPEIEKMAANPDVTVRSRGVMEKCTYCTQRINAAKISAKLAGRALRDGDITTACEQACPTRAITFGDIRDPASRVSRMKAQERDYVMLEELNNRPRTSYLAKLRNPHPELVVAGPGHPEHHG